MALFIVDGVDNCTARSRNTWRVLDPKVLRNFATRFEALEMQC
jgi:hypothetical protein